MNDFAQRPVVRADGSGAVEERRRPPATCAEVERRRLMPRPQRIAAAGAQWRCERENRGPACRTDRTVERRFEARAAAGTDGREQNTEERVGAAAADVAERGERQADTS